MPSSLTVLNSYALVHLYQPTCVGLQYGSQYFLLVRRLTNLEVFPEPLIRRIGSPKITFSSQLVFIYRSRNIFPDFPKKTNLLFEPQSNEGLAFSTTLLHSQKNIRSTGILTCYPSSTPFGLDLGPTNPWMTAIAMETLGFRRAGFSPA